MSLEKILRKEIDYVKHIVSRTLLPDKGATENNRTTVIGAEVNVTSLLKSFNCDIIFRYCVA